MLYQVPQRVANIPVEVSRGVGRQDPIMRLHDSRSAQEFTKNCALVAIFFGVRHKHQRQSARATSCDADIGTTSVLILGACVVCKTCNGFVTRWLRISRWALKMR